MGAFSIFHYLAFLSLLSPAGLLPLFIKPRGPNRFGAPAQAVGWSTAVARCIVKYAGFNGRARRSEYWWFRLTIFLVTLVLGLIRPEIGAVALLAFVLPDLAAAGRRLHDINGSAWWLLLTLTGLGAIGLVVLLVWPSQKDDTAQVF